MNGGASRDATRAMISLGAFRHNIGCVRSYCGAAVRVMPVVKANAYGHGLMALAGEAASGGADALAVARVSEALELRREGIALPLLVFEIPPAPSIEGALAEGVELTVSTRDSAADISAAASRAGTAARVHVKVDTGMTRLGFPAEIAAEEIAGVLRLPRIELAGVYSHFATSDEADTTFARLQIARFRDLLERLRRGGIEPPLVHMANSGAVIQLPEAHFGMVRPGIMLYGYPPSRALAERHPVTPVLTLVSTISMLRTVEPGTTVSYGRRYAARTKTVIATVPIGYGDGYSRLLTGRAEVIIRGRRYPVAGTICMDHIMVDLGPQTDCSAGDVVTLIGRDGGEAITAWDIASALGTIPYEVTCAIAARVPREYVA